MTSAKRASNKQPSAKTDSKPTKPYVDLSKLRKTSLKRYKKHFNLDVKADSKTELLEAVGRHFAQMPVREAEVTLEFYNFIRGLRAKQQRTAQQQQAAEHNHNTHTPNPNGNPAPTAHVQSSSSPQQQPTLASTPSPPPPSTAMTAVPAAQPATAAAASGR